MGNATNNWRLLNQNGKNPATRTGSHHYRLRTCRLKAKSGNTSINWCVHQRALSTHPRIKIAHALQPPMCHAGNDHRWEQQCWAVNGKQKRDEQKARWEKRNKRGLRLKLSAIDDGRVDDDTYNTSTVEKKGPIPHIGNAWCFWITRKIFIITSLVHSSFFLSLSAALAFSRYLSIALSCSRPLSVYCSDRNFIGTQPIPQFPAEPFNHPNRWIAFVCLLFAANHSVPFRSDSQPRPIVSIRGNRVTEKAEFTSAANCWYGGCGQRKT